MDKDLIAAIVLVALLIVQQYLNRKKGLNNATRLENETNQLARQTSATVNKCSQRVSDSIEANEHVVAVIKEFLAKNDFGHLHDRQSEALQMLVKMGENQSLCMRALDGIANITRSIADDIQQTNSELAHEKIEGRLETMKIMITDVKSKLNQL